MGLATALGVIGTGVSAIGAIGTGEAESATASYQAQVAQNNATVANQNANYTIAAGETKSYDQALAERAKAGAITTGIAADNIDVNTGSAKDVRETQAGTGMQDVETVRQQAAMQAYGYRTQATSFTAESQLEQAESGFDTEAGFLKGVGGLLSGGAKFVGGSFPNPFAEDYADADYGGGGTALAEGGFGGGGA